jgi:hypothetical protein
MGADQLGDRERAMSGIVFSSNSRFCGKPYSESVKTRHTRCLAWLVKGRGFGMTQARDE